MMHMEEPHPGSGLEAIDCGICYFSVSMRNMWKQLCSFLKSCDAHGKEHEAGNFEFLTVESVKTNFLAE